MCGGEWRNSVFIIPSNIKDGENVRYEDDEEKKQEGKEEEKKQEEKAEENKSGDT